jgi:hypothetical protein
MKEYEIVECDVCGGEVHVDAEGNRAEGIVDTLKGNLMNPCQCERDVP